MNSFTYRIVALGLALAAFFVLVGDSRADLEQDPVAVNSTVDVSIVDFDFDPSIIAIQPGDTVRWTNNSAFVPHTTTSGGPFDPVPGLVWDSGFMSAGDTYSFVFDSAEEYDYFCEIHPLTMFGQVIVGGTGVQVAMAPDDISPGALSNLDVDVSVFNFTSVGQSGDLWFTVVLPSGGEINIPASFLSLPSNPISGQVAAMDRLDFLVTISVPPTAPTGQYEVKAKVGTYPSGIADETSFEFEVP